MTRFTTANQMVAEHRLPLAHQCLAAAVDPENARDKLEVTVEEVTPEMAKRWLTTLNVHNRVFKDKVAAGYARDMMSGNWREAGDPIRFCKRGHIQDAQHRLYAQVVSGTTQTYLVVRGLEPDAQEIMDTGARRSAADALYLGGQANASSLAAVARLCIMWETGRRSYFGKSGVATIPEIQSFIEANPDVVLAAERARGPEGKRVLMPSAIVGMLWWVFNRIDPFQANDFFTKLGTGAGLEQNDPRLTLRNRIASIKNDPEKAHQRLTRDAYVSLLCRAWNAYREGRPLERIQITTGRENEQFPEPR